MLHGIGRRSCLVMVMAELWPMVDILYIMYDSIYARPLNAALFHKRMFNIRENIQRQRNTMLCWISVRWRSVVKFNTCIGIIKCLMVVDCEKYLLCDAHTTVYDASSKLSLRYNNAIMTHTCVRYQLQRTLSCSHDLDVDQLPKSLT